MATSRRIRACVGLLGLALVAAACGDGTTSRSDNAQSDVVTAAPAQSSDTAFGSMSALGSVMGDVTSAVASKAADGILGWAAAAIGMGGSDPSAEVVSQLKQIEAELQQVEKQLGEIEQELKVLDCTNSSQDLINAVASIDSWYQQYQTDVVTVGKDGDAIDTAQVEKLFDAVLDPSAGVVTQLSVVANHAVNPEAGALAKCIAAASPPIQGSVDDRPWYDENVFAIEQYLLGAYTSGTILYAEAQDFLAWLEAGSPTGTPSQVAAKVCGNNAPPSTTSTTAAGATAPALTASARCDEIPAQTAQWQAQIVQMLTVGGAPLSTQDMLLVNGAPTGTKDHVLLPVSLEDFNGSVPGQSCTSPLSSADPCGAVVGDYTELGGADPWPTAVFPGVYQYDSSASRPSEQTAKVGTCAAADACSYSGWTSANATQLDWLLTHFGSSPATATLGEFLMGKDGAGAGTCPTAAQGGGVAPTCTAFTDMANKIIITPNTSSIYGTDGVCFIDTNIKRSDSGQPWCGGNFSDLFHQTASGDCNALDSVRNWPTPCVYADFDAPSFTSESVLPSFYDLSMESITTYSIAYDWHTKPKWSTDQKARQFHWPALDTSTLSCDQGLSPLNPAQVPTMCGDNLYTWMNTFVGFPVKVPSA